MTPVYDSWAQYYDIAEGDRSLFLDFYLPLVSATTRSLLELGCGTGAITSAMARRMVELHGDHVGLRISGVDESVEMLRIARERDRDRRIEWVSGDFRSPPVEGEYDLIVCPFNALQFLPTEEDLCAAFRSVRRLLAPRGLFAFDIYQPNLEYLSKPQFGRLVRSVKDSDERVLELREDTDYDPISRFMMLDWRLVDPAASRVPLATMRYRLRQYFAAEIDSLLGIARLAVHQKYGDFDRSPFTSASKKQIVLCGRG